MSHLKIFYGILITLFFICLGENGWAFSENEKISPQLAYVLDRTEKPVPIIVMLKQIPTISLFHWTVAQKEQYLKIQTLRAQGELREFVNSLASENHFTGEKPIQRYKFFWNVNALMARATAEIIFYLADREDVISIQLDRKIKLGPIFAEEAEVIEGEYTYGLEKIGIPALRSEHPEINGQGVIVGILDTGLDAKHPEVSGRVIAFKDYVNQKTDPYDDHGHGTHVAGTIGGVGANNTQIGVAPAVKFVIGKVFSSGGSGSISEILQGMEWITDPDGNPNTNDRPRVVSNSWGGGMSDNIKDDPFSRAVLTWVEMNIFPSFAAGNSGPSSESVGSPGGLPQSFAVGATDENDKVADFSSRGPVNIIIDGKKTTYIKPDVSAPGVKVYSSLPGGRYGKYSGTSMATPHVTGAIALLVQVKPQLTVPQIREMLEKSADKLGRDKKNNDLGSGRLNVYKALVLGFE